MTLGDPPAAPVESSSRLSIMHSHEASHPGKATDGPESWPSEPPSGLLQRVSHRQRNARRQDSVVGPGEHNQEKRRCEVGSGSRGWSSERRGEPRGHRRITAESPLLRLIIGSRGRRDPCILQLRITISGQSEANIYQRSAQPPVDLIFPRPTGAEESKM